MNKPRILIAAAAAAAAVALPWNAFAAASLTYSVNPTTHGAVSATSSTTVTSARTLTSSQTNLAAGEKICENGQTCAPPNGTVIGSSDVTAQWSFLFCGSQKETFTIKAVSPINTKTYSFPTGWSVVGQILITNSLANVDGYDLKNSSGNYAVYVPSYPNLTCANTSATLDTNFDASVTVSGTTYNLHNNPTAVTCSNTVTETLNYSSGSPDNLSTTYCTT